MNILFAGKTISDIVNDYSDMLIRIAYQNVNNMSEAEDIVQEVYIKLLHSEINFETPKHLKAWLIRVLINKCKDYFKSSWFRKTLPMKDSFDFLAPEEKEIMDEIFSLDIKYRNVIYLYYYEGYSLKEISSMMNQSINTTSSILQRGRKKLKKIILEEEI